MRNQPTEFTSKIADPKISRSLYFFFSTTYVFFHLLGYLWIPGPQNMLGQSKKKISIIVEAYWSPNILPNTEYSQ